MDYTGKDDDRSLRWNKRRNDRADFDFCATSPPADGFFFANHSTTGCEQTIADKNIPNQVGANNSSQQRAECVNSAHGGFLKSSFGSGNNSGSVLKMDSRELQRWAQTNIGNGDNIMHAPDDTAPTPIDHIPQFQRIVPSITRTDDNNSGGSGSGGPLRLVDKLTQYTPDVTPKTTPVPSPSIVRRTTNPFFSGGTVVASNKKEDGNWLFRSNAKSDCLYEAQVELQPANPGMKNTRYVPKPSQLRELNFFSPSSM
jgi:hypothetical protein